MQNRKNKLVCIYDFRVAVRGDDKVQSVAKDMGGCSGEKEKVIKNKVEELSIEGVGWDSYVETEVSRVRSGTVAAVPKSSMILGRDWKPGE